MAGFEEGEAYRRSLNPQTTLFPEKSETSLECVSSEALPGHCSIHNIPCSLEQSKTRGCLFTTEQRKNLLGPPIVAPPGMENIRKDPHETPKQAVMKTLRSPLVPKVRKPVRIHFMKGQYVNEHLQFWCQGYRPYGGNPEYPDKDRKYRGDSEMCDGCFKIIDGVPFRAPFRCTRDNGGNEYYIHYSLFNPNPLDHVDKYERKEIAAGMKLLFLEEKHGTTRKPRTKKTKPGGTPSNEAPSEGGKSAHEN